MVDCKTNFGEQYEHNLECRVCKEPNSRETEDHILICPVLSSDKPVKFIDVFGDTDQQFKATQIFKKYSEEGKCSWMLCRPESPPCDGPDVSVHLTQQYCHSPTQHQPNLNLT